MASNFLNTLLQLAGVAQLILAIVSLSIPKLLNWKGELAATSVLIKQMFWTYAAYIFLINICFGLVSLFACYQLTDGSALATMLNGFIAAYWISRVAVQFFYFDRAAFPRGAFYVLGESLLVLLFIALSGVYTDAFIYNLRLP